MGALGTPTILDSWRDRAATGPGTYETYLVTMAGGSASSDYATGGQTFSLTDVADYRGAQFVSLEVIAVSAITRRWEWDGSQSAPKLVARDAFATEEGNTTTVNTDTLTCLLRVKR